MTEDGNTIAGRNMDWHPLPMLMGSQVIVAHLPATGSDDHRLGVDHLARFDRLHHPG